jgi:Protein of unknown function (DUF4236)
MPLRFNRRFTAGLFRVNVSRSGVSGSIGRRGAWLTIGRDRVRTSLGVPATGLGWYRQQRVTTARSRILNLLAIGLIVIVVMVALLLR